MGNKIQEKWHCYNAALFFRNESRQHGDKQGKYKCITYLDTPRTNAFTLHVYVLFYICREFKMSYV